MWPCRDHSVDIRAPIDVGTCRSRSQFPVKPCVARAIIRDAAGRVELDGLERAEKRPAQAEAILHGMIEIFGRDQTLTHQAKRFGEQRALQAIQDKAVDLAVDGDGHLPDVAIDVSRALDGFRRGPWRAAQFDQRHQMRWIDGMTNEATPPDRK